MPQLSELLQQGSARQLGCSSRRQFCSATTELRRAAQDKAFLPAMWAASLTLPAPRGKRQMRLIIKEYERLTTDAADRGNISAVGSSERLIYADEIDV